MPFPIVSIFIGEHRVALAIVVASGIALAVMFSMAGGYLRLSRDDTWLWAFVVFLVVGVVALLLSPYREAAVTKGLFQVLGLLSMVGLAIAVVHTVKRQPMFLLRVARCLSITLGVVALGGIAQFALANILGLPQAFDLRFVNEWVGGVVWRSPGFIGDVQRANSVITEPAHFAQYLGLAAGLSLVRIGLLGRRYSRSLSSTVPLWASVSVLVGVVLSLSVLGLVLFVVTVLAVRLLPTKRRSPNLMGSGFMLGVLVSLLGAISFVVGSDFQDKVRSVDLIWSVPTSSSVRIGEHDLSALAVATNFQVMKRNMAESPVLGVGLGAHPNAYEDKSPAFITTSPALKGLNAQDGASLMVRLLSETGLAGALAFLVGCLWVLLRARRAIVAVGPLARSDPRVRTLESAAIGFEASLAGILVVSLLRFPVYYADHLWLALALVASSCVAIRVSVQRTRSHSPGSNRRPLPLAAAGRAFGREGLGS